jgi:hypothetical protein
MSDDNVMAYISRCVCGGITFACVDRPEYAKDTAKDIAQLIRDGRAVERVTLEVTRSGWCSNSKKCRAASQPAPVTP